MLLEPRRCYLKFFIFGEEQLPKGKGEAVFLFVYKRISAHGKTNWFAFSLIFYWITWSGQSSFLQICVLYTKNNGNLFPLF